MSNPIPENIRAIANDIARLVAGALPKDVGFALLLFDFGEGGNMSYISNAGRDDMLKAMNELLHKMRE